MYPKLRQHMSDEHVSIEGLARELDMSYVTLNNKLNGKHKFSLNEAKKIADRFHSTIDHIFFNK